MKIPIINDLHFGVRNGNTVFGNELIQFFEKDFVPYIKENDITDIIVAGDVFDDRNAISVKTLNIFREIFLEGLKDFNVHIILGNHDIRYKDTLTPNSVEPLTYKYDNITIYKDPTVVNFDGYPIQFISWICRENEDDMMKAIASKKGKTLVTHMDVIGSQHVPGVFLDHGYDPATFYEYDHVLNGHIHTRSKIAGNITNMGSQYQMSWSDFGQTKGFHVLDTSNAELTFIPNEKPDLFVKVFYDTNLIGGVEPLLWLDNNKEFLTDKFIKIIVTGTVDRLTFDTFLNIINNEIRTHDVKIIEDVTGMFDAEDSQVAEFLKEQGKTTIQIMNEMIDNLVLDGSYNKETIKGLMAKFYTEAINQDAFAD